MKKLTKVLAITSMIILVFAVILSSTMFTLIYKNAGPFESTAPTVSSDNIFTTETRSPESNTLPGQNETTSAPGTTNAPQTTAPPPTTTAPPPETTSPPETEPPEPEYDFTLTLSKDRTYYILSSVGRFKGTELVVPETYKGLPVSEIGNRAFGRNETLKTILIPGTVKIIRECAFEYSAIETVTFMSEGLEVIENGAFRYSKQLKNITLPNTLKTLGGKTFMECESIKIINFSGSVADWVALEKEEDWNSACPEITVICTDGTVTVKENKS